MQGGRQRDARPPTEKKKWGVIKEMLPNVYCAMQSIQRDATLQKEGLLILQEGVLSTGVYDALERCISINESIWEVANDFTARIPTVIRPSNAQAPDKLVAIDISEYRSPGIGGDSGSGPDSRADPEWDPEPRRNSYLDEVDPPFWPRAAQR